MSEKTCCLFSLSKKDERFRKSDLDDVENWLLNEKGVGHPYLFAGKSPKKVTIGWKLLFSFEAQVFGKATAESEVEEISFDEQERRRKLGKYVYTHSIVLKSSSCKLLNKTHSYPTKKEITKELGFNFGQVFTYLTEKDYQSILEMAKYLTAVRL